MNYETRFDSDNAAFGEATLAGSAPRRSWLKVVLIVLVLLVALVAIWFATHGKGSAELSEADKAGQAPVVSVISPGRTTIVGTINATGTLAARREIPVGSVGEGGQVVAVLVEQGQWVRQGQVLAVIDRSVQVQQAAGQAAQIRVAEADARLAQANLQRSLRLVERGFVSRADVDRLTATRDAANARVQVARAQLGTLQAQSARLNIHAPASGLVLERRVEPGQVVGGGSGVLFRLAKDGEMELLAQLGETELAQLARGVSAEVIPAGTSQAFVGQIWQLAPVINPQTRQGTARIALAYAPQLRPGGFASVTIRSGTVVAPMLPDSAILSDEQGEYVFIVGNNDKIERRTIKSGLVTNQGIAIAEGLAGTERVVLRAGGFLSTGETVKPVVVKQ